MRQLQSQAEQDRDDWGAWLKWTPMGDERYAGASSEYFRCLRGCGQMPVQPGLLVLLGKQAPPQQAWYRGHD
jgi:hypothetical protein